jgi:hypothetical protein
LLGIDSVVEINKKNTIVLFIIPPLNESSVLPKNWQKIPTHKIVLVFYYKQLKLLEFLIKFFCDVKAGMKTIFSGTTYHML